MTDNVNHTPDFVCSVSIERTEKMGAGAPATLPPVRADAGVINGKELFAWPASDEDKTRLKQVLAVYGKAGTGSFALYARAVFLTSAATFYDAPDETKDGKRLTRVDFAIPRDASRYSLIKDGQPLTLAYSGSIWTDPETSDVARLALEAEGLPQELGLKAVSQTLEYGRVKIGSSAVLLPVASDLRLQEMAGREAHLTSHFTDCHPYVAKSGELFVADALEAPAAVSPGAVSSPATYLAAAPTAAASLSPARNIAPSPQESLPAHIRFDTLLDDRIDERVTGDGSALSFRTLQDLKKSGKVIVPKSAEITGHVTRIIRQKFVVYSTVKGYYVVGIQMDNVTVGDRKFQVWANLETIGPPADSIGFLPYSSSPDRWGLFEDIHIEFVTPPAAPGESFLGILQEYLRLPRKMRMSWVTVEPPQ
jgi:hypothetical protein